MRETDNFDLSLYEGTDKFNPLTVENANMTKIDEQMAKNFAGTIGIATELKSGTVHALTREDDTPVFRFVATSNYTAGDTFTVDGLQVSGLLADGRTLSTGAYVINANVLCCLVGTVLTFYVTAGSVETADNSLKLGGELPSYYGKASDVVDAKNVAQASSTLVNSLNNELKTLTTGTLVAGQTSITLSNVAISSTSIIDVYYRQNLGVATEPIVYTTMTVNNGSVTLTFESRSADLVVGIRIL